MAVEWVLNKYSTLTSIANNETRSKDERLSAMDKRALLDEFLIDIKNKLKGNDDE